MASLCAPNASPIFKAISEGESRLRCHFGGGGIPMRSRPPCARLPPIDLGILRRRSGSHGESQGQDRNIPVCANCFLSRLIPRIYRKQKIKNGNPNRRRRFHSSLAVVLIPIFYFSFPACLHAQKHKKEKVDLLVTGGTAVTMNANAASSRTAPWR